MNWNPDHNDEVTDFNWISAKPSVELCEKFTFSIK